MSDRVAAGIVLASAAALVFVSRQVQIRGGESTKRTYSEEFQQDLQLAIANSLRNKRQRAAPVSVSEPAMKPKGLQNLGNKCYQNCVLTALMCVDEIVEVVKFEGAQCSPLAESVQAVLSLARSGSTQQDIDMSLDIYFTSLNQCRKLASMTHQSFSTQYGLSNASQQDAYDFFIDLISSLGGVDDTTRRDYSTLGRLLDIKMRKNWAPESPHMPHERNVSGERRSDVVHYLKLLQINPPDQYCSSVQQLVDGSLGWEKNENAQASTHQRFMQDTVLDVGSVLVISVKRFVDVDAIGTSTRFVDTPLHLTKLLNVPLHDQRSGKPTGQIAKFKLVSFCEHSGGDLRGGHYTSKGRIDGKWWKFDDANVTALDGPETVSRGAQQPRTRVHPRGAARDLASYNPMPGVRIQHLSTSKRHL